MLRQPQLEKKLGCAGSSIWRYVNNPKLDFPLPIYLMPGTLVWFEDEVDEWISKRPRYVPRRARRGATNE
jgi:prophage regulatory protein